MAKHTQQDYGPRYVQMWHDMRITKARRGIVEQSARRIFASRAEYMAVERETGVPWWFVGIVHKMECNCNFGKHLHNGDPLTARTRLVPAGRPKTGSPPFSWHESAVDALKLKNLHKRKDWSLPAVAYEFERFNGFGYRARGINSPYLWSMTNHYQAGKYVADGKFSASAVSSQSGALALLMALQEIDGSVHFEAQQPVLALPDEGEQLPPAKPPALVGRTLYGWALWVAGGVFYVITKGVDLARDVGAEAHEIAAPITQMLGLIGMEWAALGLVACGIGAAIVLYARVNAHLEGKIG